MPEARSQLRSLCLPAMGLFDLSGIQTAILRKSACGKQKRESESRKIIFLELALENMVQAADKEGQPPCWHRCPVGTARAILE